MFTRGFDRYTCDGDSITCTVGNFDLTATIHHDYDPEAPWERIEGFWPSRDPHAARYVEEKDFDAEQARAEAVAEAWKNAEWGYVGIAVTVAVDGVRLTGRYDHALWGVECNYPGGDNSYLTDVANDLVPEALQAAEKKLQAICRKCRISTQI